MILLLLLIVNLLILGQFLNNVVDINELIKFCEDKAKVSDTHVYHSIIEILKKNIDSKSIPVVNITNAFDLRNLPINTIAYCDFEYHDIYYKGKIIVIDAKKDNVCIDCLGSKTDTCKLIDFCLKRYRNDDCSIIFKNVN
jgi:hypothetical protein